MNFALSYSGGKDSALALHRMKQQGHTPVALITTVNIEQKRSWFHGIQNDLMLAAADSMGIPLIAAECVPDDYTREFEDALAEARRMGAEACVFGDIDIDGHKEWDEERCESAGLACLLPLWKQDREALVHETINAGFRAVIKIIQSDKLDESFLGQTLTIPLIEKMKALSANGAEGIDICGENGEYHTFVYDGPGFARPVSFRTGGVIDFGAHKAIDIFL